MIQWFRMYVNSVMVKDVLPVYSGTSTFITSIPLNYITYWLMYDLIVLDLCYLPYIVTIMHRSFPYCLCCSSYIVDSSNVITLQMEYCVFGGIVSRYSIRISLHMFLFYLFMYHHLILIIIYFYISFIVYLYCMSDSIKVKIIGNHTIINM